MSLGSQRIPTMQSDRDMDLALALAMAEASDHDDFQGTPSKIILSKQDAGLRKCQSSGNKKRTRKGVDHRNIQGKENVDIHRKENQTQRHNRGSLDLKNEVIRYPLASITCLNTNIGRTDEIVTVTSKKKKKKSVDEKDGLRWGHGSEPNTGRQVQNVCTPSKRNNIELESEQELRGMEGNGNDSPNLVAENMNQTQELPSLGSQMNALIRMCSEAARTDVSLEEVPCSFRGFQIEDDLEEVTSLMTQAENPVTESRQKLLCPSQLETMFSVTPDNAQGKSSCIVHREIIICPICNVNITELSSEIRQAHSNKCLDMLVEGPKILGEEPKYVDVSVEVSRTYYENPLGDAENSPQGDSMKKLPCQVDPCAGPPALVDVVPVVEWLEKLKLSRYADLFVKNEIDWETLQWLTDEDLCTLGINAFGPRKKILSAIQQLNHANNGHRASGRDLDCNIEINTDHGQQASCSRKLITDFFQIPGGVAVKSPFQLNSKVSGHQKLTRPKPNACNFGLDICPQWMKIPGTKFRVEVNSLLKNASKAQKDAFKHLTKDCHHWFLTHFHTDHYQGLTKHFRHGTVYCSLVTARLVNMRIGIPWTYLKTLPVNEKVQIEGVNVTFIDANHCPGSIMILFELPNGKNVLHTGDFRFNIDILNDQALLACSIHTLILDTTYCDPQYDFPKQEAVIQFVIDAIQAEAFNPTTLFLIGTYTIGKERLFLEVAKVLQKKIYVGAAKLRTLSCLGLPEEEMRWITSNDMESHIHVVPLWSVASFKRMASISRHYHGRFNSIVSFSPTGWSFGRGKKRTNGKRWQQGTIIRYEVPYSEHCSFTELKAFVKFINPEVIIPSVNNKLDQATDNMVACLLEGE